MCVGLKSLNTHTQTPLQTFIYLSRAPCGQLCVFPSVSLRRVAPASLNNMIQTGIWLCGASESKPVSRHRVSRLNHLYKEISSEVIEANSHHDFLIFSLVWMKTTSHTLTFCCFLQGRKTCKSGNNEAFHSHKNEGKWRFCSTSSSSSSWLFKLTGRLHRFFLHILAAYKVFLTAASGFSRRLPSRIILCTQNSVCITVSPPSVWLPRCLDPLPSKTWTAFLFVRWFSPQQLWCEEKAISRPLLSLLRPSRHKPN